VRRRRLALFAGLPTLSALPALSGCGIGLRQSGASTADREAPRIEVQAAFEAVTSGRAILVDVRGESSYRFKRAAGAILLPLDEVELAPADALKKLPAGKQPILYCT
jgi:hypothetical protein